MHVSLPAKSLFRFQQGLARPRLRPAGLRRRAQPNKAQQPPSRCQDVPVKSVCRFRCVCKDWLALISDPAFVTKHKSRTPPEQLLVGCYWDVNLLLIGCYLNLPPSNGGVVVMDMEGNVLRTIKGLGMFPAVNSSLHNLVCFSELDAVTRMVDVTTGKVLATWRPLESGDKNAYAIAIRLGRASRSNSTKVVRLTEYSGDQPRQTWEVLTLGVHDSAWRQAPSPLTAVRVSCDECSGATVNGVMHFLSSTHWIPHMPANNVVCFDLETELWSKTIQGPLNAYTELWSKTELVRLAVLKEALCLVQTEQYEASDRRTNIWLLVDAGKSIWVKKYVIRMAISFYIIEPLTVMPDGVKLLLYCRSNNSQMPVLRVYDPSAGTCADAVKLPKNEFYNNVVVCNLHLDCFVTPGRSNVTSAGSTFNTRIGPLNACR